MAFLLLHNYTDFIKYSFTTLKTENKVGIATTTLIIFFNIFPSFRFCIKKYQLIA